MGRWDGYVRKQKACSNTSCTNLVWKGTYCSKCKKRLRVHGDINKVLSKRKLEYNENFIEHQTKEACWFIGWITSDGYINEIHPAVSLEICDREPLEIIAKLMNYNGQIKEYRMRKNQKKQSYLLFFNDKKLVDDFVKIGIRQNKSKSIQMPIINPEFFYHFLRGVIEGDGSIVSSDNRQFVFLNSSSKIFLEQIALVVNLPFKIREMKTGVYRLVYWDKHANELCIRIYKDSDNLRLERKYKKWLISN